MEMIQLIKEADDLIRKVVARYNGLYTQQGRASQIELDLMLDDIRQLYEKFKLLGQLNMMPPAIRVDKPASAAPSPANPPAETWPEPKEERVMPVGEQQSETVAKPVHQPPQSEEFNAEKTDRNTAPEKTPAPEHMPPPKENEPRREINHEQPAESRISPPPEVKESPKPSGTKTSRSPIQSEKPQHTLADTFHNEKKSLSETIVSPVADSSLGTRMQAQPIADLKAAIGLNERFNFITDLFANDLLGFDEAVKQLNNAANREEALAFLASLGEKYHWDDSMSALSRFTEFVHRRFM